MGLPSRNFSAMASSTSADQVVAGVLRLGEHGRGDVALLRRVGLLAGEGHGAHAHEVDGTLEAVLGADGQLDGRRPRAQPRLDLLDDGREVGPHAVHLVDEGQARHAELVRLVPHRLRLRLDPIDGREDHHGAVEDAQAALDLDGEIDVARRVDEVQLVIAPVEHRRRGGDGDAALALLGHPVHLGVALVDLADLVDLSGVEEEALGDRRLARVDVGDDANVPHAVDLGHGADGLYSSRVGDSHP
jgi:hypothetical protein